MNTTIELNPFHLQLFYNNYDFSYTWLEHGGFTGHIEYKKRKELQRTRAKIDGLLLQNIGNNEKAFSPILNTYKKIFNLLCQKDNKNNIQFTDIEFEYFLLSGFSRCGGTYLLNEYYKMRGLELSKEHIEFTHDFFPPLYIGYDVAHDTELNKMEEYDAYFSTFIAYLTYGRKAFLKRTVWGTFMISYIHKIKKYFPGMTVFWRHIIRDVHGAYYSIKRMYDGFDDVFKYMRLTKNSFDTDFGNIVMLWFMQNTSILPTVRGLPFWHIYIDTNKSCAEINQQITKIIDDYLKNSDNSHNYSLGKPKIIKFGKEAETECLKDARSFNNVKYQPGKFNCKSVEEVDDKYTEVYEHLLAQLTRLYQAFGLNFDGKLDRV